MNSSQIFYTFKYIFLLQYHDNLRVLYHLVTCVVDNVELRSLLSRCVCDSVGYTPSELYNI